MSEKSVCLLERGSCLESSEGESVSSAPVFKGKVSCDLVNLTNASFKRVKEKIRIALLALIKIAAGKYVR